MANDFNRGIRVYLETSDYGKGIDDMVAKTKKYSSSLDELRAEAEKMTASGQNQGKAWDDLQRKIKQNEVALGKAQSAEESYRNKMKETEKVLKNLSGSTRDQLIEVQKQLRKELSKTGQETDEYKAKLKQLEKVNTQLSKANADMNSSIGSSGSFWGKAADGFNRYLALFTAGFAAVTGFTLALKGFMDLGNEKQQSAANLQALTGLDDQSIDWLIKKAEELSTTTTEAGVKIQASSKEILEGFTVIGSKRPELLKNKEALAEVTEQALVLAETGVPVADAFDVVTASMNQFNLGSDKSREIINTIAAGALAGSAEANNLAGSLKNVGTVANDSNMSLADTVAELEVLASKQLVGEEAGTKLRGALLKLKEAGVGYVSGQFNLRDALIEVNDQLERKAKAEEKDALKVKLFGAENVTAGTIMLQNISAYDKMREAVTGTNSAYDQAIIRTNTVSAQLAQAKNRFNELGMDLVKNFSPAMLSLANVGNLFLKMLVKLPGLLKENKGLIITVVSVLSAYTVAIYANVIASRLKATAIRLNTEATLLDIVATKAGTVASLAAAAAQALLTGNIVRFRAAMKLLRAELMMNPYIALGVVIAAITVGVYKLISAQLKLTETQEAHVRIQEKVDDQFGSQKDKVEVLTSIVHNNRIALDERNKALTELKKIVPGYHASLTDEGKLINDNSMAISNYLLLLEKEIRMQAAKDELIELYKKKRLQEKESTKADEALNKQKQFSDGNTYGASTGGAYTQGKLKALEVNAINAKKALDGTAAAIANVEQEIASTPATMTIFQPTRNKPAATTKHATAGLTDEEKKKLEKERKEQLDRDLKSVDLWLITRLNKIKEAKLKNEPEIIIDGNNLCIQSDKEYADAAQELGIQALQKKQLLYKKGSKEYQDLQSQINDIQLKKQKEADEALLKATQDAYKSMSESTDKFYDMELQKLEKANDGSLEKQKQYEKDILLLNQTTAERRKRDAENYRTIVEYTNFKSEEDRVAATKAANDAVQKANKDLAQATKAVNDAKLKEEEDYAQKRQALLDKYGLSDNKSIRAQYRKELTELKKALKDKLLTEKEYAEAVKQVKLKAAIDYAQQAVNYAGMVSDAVSAYHQAEADSLEVQKQRELTAAGDNAEAREKIEKEYAQKELDLKKKQSGADMAIKITQTLAAGALAVMQAFAQLGPIGGAIAAVLIGTTTAFQVASIVKQREALMATSLDNSSSSSSSSSSGARIVTQAADGRWDVVGEDDGVTYRNVPFRGPARTGIVSGPTLVAERGDELIVDNPTLRRIRMDAPWVLSTIRNMRVAQRATGNYSQLPASGSSSGSGQTQVNNDLLQANTDAITEMIALLMWLRENGIPAYVFLDDLEKKQFLKNYSQSKGSLS